MSGWKNILQLLFPTRLVRVEEYLAAIVSHPACPGGKISCSYRMEMKNPFIFSASLPPQRGGSERGFLGPSLVAVRYQARLGKPGGSCKISGCLGKPGGSCKISGPPGQARR